MASRVEGDAGGVFGAGADVFVDEAGFDLVGVGHDLFVAGGGGGVGRGEFEAVESAFAGERLAAVLGADAVLAQRILLAAEAGQERIGAEGVVVVEVFVAQGQAVGALAQQAQEVVFEAVGVAVVGETGEEAFQAAVAAIQAGEQHAAAVAADVAGGEIDGDGPFG